MCKKKYERAVIGHKGLKGSRGKHVSGFCLSVYWERKIPAVSTRSNTLTGKGVENLS